MNSGTPGRLTDRWSLFNLNSRISKGPVTVRNVAGLYVYEKYAHSLGSDGPAIERLASNRAAPAGYFVIGDGPIIGD